MNLPEWLSRELAAVGAQNAERAITRQEAVTRLRDVIIQHADRAFQLSLAADFAARQLDTWHRGHKGERAPAAAQSELFPGLAARMFIRPNVAKAVVLFTRHDWQTAKAVLENRTKYAIEGAQAERAAFDAAYAAVVPLLTDDQMTTADVASELAGQAAPAVPPARFATP